MSEDEFQWEPEALRRAPYIVQYMVALAAIRDAPDDPEDTALLSITLADLAVLAFGCRLVEVMFPEVAPRVIATVSKIQEVTNAQGFLTNEDTGGVS